MQPMPMTPGDFLQTLKRRRWSLILPAAIIFIASSLVALTLPSIYISTSTILIEEQEINLVSSLTRYPEVLERAALQYEPHLLINYLRELAAEFHTYYNAHPFIVDDAVLRNTRLNLICAVKQVLANGLNLLRINTPEAM